MCEFWICGFSAVCQITNYIYIYISLFTLNYVSSHNFCLFGHLVNKVWSIVNVELTPTALRIAANKYACFSCFLNGGFFAFFLFCQVLQSFVA